MSFCALLSRSPVPLGTMIGEFDTPGIGHIAKAAGLDYVFLDLEHSGFGLGDLKRLLVYFQAAGLPVMVRPPSKSGHHISRALDAGAEALLMPMVASAEEAADLVRMMRYPPAAGAASPLAWPMIATPRRPGGETGRRQPRQRPDRLD